MKEHGKDNMQPKTGAQSFLEEGVYPTKPPSFEIDREKLRQWDLMSSAPVAMINAIQRYPDVETHQIDTNAMPTIAASDSAPPNMPGLYFSYPILSIFQFCCVILLVFRRPLGGKGNSGFFSLTSLRGLKKTKINYFCM